MAFLVYMDILVGLVIAVFDGNGDDQDWVLIDGDGNDGVKRRKKVRYEDGGNVY